MVSLPAVDWQRILGDVNYRSQASSARVDPMSTASGIFINGIAWVFTGLAVLSDMLKMRALVAGRPASVSPATKPV